MDTNTNSSNGGAHGEEKSVEECQARLESSKQRKEAESKRHRKQKNQALYEK